MHARERRILASLAGLVLAIGAGPTTLLAQGTGAGAAPSRGTPKVPAAGTSKTAAPVQAQTKAQAPAGRVDPAARKAGAQDDAIPPRAKDDPEAERKMDEILARWEKKSASIKSLSVKYKRVDVTKLFDKRTEFEGQAHFTSANKAYLDFNEVVPGKANAFDERIVCDGENVYQFKGPTRQVFVFALPADRRQKAIQQGPLPFLFNMKAAEAKQRYKMIFKKEDETSYQILIIPMLSIDREEYSQALIRLDKQRLIPTGIHLVAPNGKETKTFTFSPSDLVENQAILPSWFDGRTMMASLKRNGWTIEYPQPEGQPQGAAAPALGARTNPPAAGARPAMKGQSGGVRQK